MANAITGLRIIMSVVLLFCPVFSPFRLTLLSVGTVIRKIDLQSVYE